MRRDREHRVRRARAPEVIAQIFALAAAGAKQKPIAKALDVSQAHVCRVLRGHR